MYSDDWLYSHRESIERVIELEDVISKSDPAERPYRSMYAARDILQGLVTDLEELLSAENYNCDPQTHLLHLSLVYRLANNFICSEETHSGEEIINTLYAKVELIPQIQSIIRLLSKETDAAGGFTLISSKISEMQKVLSEDAIIWMHSLAGILIKIYNTMAMLWASKIMNQSSDSPSEMDDIGFSNSFKYLSMAKKLYKLYKCQFSKNNNKTNCPDSSDCDYDPPECIDSLLLDYLNYETPYLKYECETSDNIQKKEDIKLDVFESDYTSTLFLLAQAFGKMSSYTSLKHKSAKYCYKTLSRQLNSLKYDPVEWSLNAATLSQYYVVEGCFKQARHCIAASQVILKEAVNRPTPSPNHKESNKSENGEVNKKETAQEKKEDNKMDVGDGDNGDSGSSTTKTATTMDCQKTVECILEESLNTAMDEIINDNDQTGEKSIRTVPNEIETIIMDNAKEMKTKKLHPDPMSESRFWDDDVYEEKRDQAKADINRCWIKYGITILENSFERFMPDNAKNMDVKEVCFSEFNIELDSVEKQVTCDYVDTFEDARQLFLFVQRQINEAREYYKIDFRCSDAIELICDHSKAFKALSHFELSVERKCCMHKKRIDMLMDLLKILNQSYYQVACRTMMLEVGEIYSTMMSLKLSLIETSATSNESIKCLKNAKGIALKIKRLAHSGIDMYQKFLDSYRTRENIMPEVFSEDDVRPVMIANFYMARMYSKIVEPDLKERVSNLHKSLSHYKFIVTYCDRHPTAAGLMASELESCRDMATLLPHKIHKLLNE